MHNASVSAHPTVSFEPFSLQALATEARSNPTMFALARRQFVSQSAHLFTRGDDKKVAITSSDAGRCAAQVQAEIAGKYDIPDADYYLRDNGTLNGAWLACLIYAAIKIGHTAYYVTMEDDRSALGVGGHTDIAIHEIDGDDKLGACVQVGEIKTTSSFTVRPPHEAGKTVPANLQHVIQACHRAMAHGAPIASVYTQGPTSFNEEHYSVDSWREAVVAEYARLAVGAMDPQREYQCKSCRVSTCPKNENQNRPAVWPGLEVTV